MKKMTKFNKKRVTFMLTGTLALAGAISSIPVPMFEHEMSAIVYAADGAEYSTVKGVATMGSGQAHIDIAGNDGQILVESSSMFINCLTQRMQKVGNPSIIPSIRLMSRP